MTSILHGLDFHADQHPDRTLFAFLDIKGNVTESYTYQQFVVRTKNIATYLSKTYDLKPGERVLLAYPPGLEMICTFFACARLGLIPVPVYPPSEFGFQSALYKMTFIAKDCGASAVLTDRTYYWSMKLNLAMSKISSFSFRTDPVSKLKWIVTNDADSSLGTNFPEAHSDILFLQYTSGSTNHPKGVMVTHDNVINNFSAVVDHVPIGVSWLPQYHDMGLIGYYLFFALKGGTTYGFSPRDFLQRPALWLEAISKFKGTASSAPNFAYSYCLKPGKIPTGTFDNLDLSSLRFLMTAAEPVRTDTYTQFLKKFEPYGLRPESFFSAYGLAEYTLAVSNYGRTVSSFDSLSLQKNIVELSDHQNPSTSLLSCGRPLGNTEVRIVDTAGLPKEVKDGQVGEIWITGDSKCLGYWNRPELSREVFEAECEPGSGSNRWLRSGDLGFIHDGELYICGRTKDLIIISGRNYYPQDIECIVEEDPAIRKGCVAAFSIEKDNQEVLVVVAEIRTPKAPPDSDAIANNITRHLGVPVDAMVFIPPRTIPKTSSGKIIRHQAKNLFLSSQLRVVSQVKPKLASHPVAAGRLPSGHADGITKPLRGQKKLEILFEQYGLSGYRAETLPDVGFDSMKLAQFTQDVKEFLEGEGFDDLSHSVEISLLQKISVAELFDILDGLNTISNRSKLQFRQVFLRLQKSRMEMERALMKKDVSDPAVTRESASNGSSSKNRPVVLTGGTGFFGPFLIKSLLEQNDSDIHVLVRAVDEETGMNRLRAQVESIGPPRNIREAFEKRVKPVCGDLSRPNLGVDSLQWNFLKENIKTIYHNGALVNYLFDYETLRDSNVKGTREVVKLASSGREKVLNHISTTFIYGWSVKETLYESDANQEMELLDFGYSQSKWVSEQIIAGAMKQGLQARIFRPALISPSISGCGYNFDVSIRLLAFMLKHGVGTTAPNQVSFTPADIAANNIVAISNISESVGHTFHVTRDEYSSMLDVTSIVSRFTDASFRYFNLQDFVPEVVGRCTRDDLLFPLLNFLVHSVDNIKSMEFKRYDNSNYRTFRELSPWGKDDPPLEDVVLGILRFMKQQGIIEKVFKEETYA